MSSLITTTIGGLVVQHFPESAIPLASMQQSCTPTQGVIALYELKGITEANVQTAINSIADPAAKYKAQVAFSRATEWRRDSTTTATLAVLLGLTAADMDALFAYAVGVRA